MNENDNHKLGLYCNDLIEGAAAVDLGLASGSLGIRVRSQFQRSLFWQ